MEEIYGGRRNTIMNRNQRTITLYEKDNMSADALLNYIADQLEFPDYFGMNFAALNDCLGDIDVPTLIEIVWDDRASKDQSLKLIGEIAESISEWNEDLTVVYMSQSRKREEGEPPQSNVVLKTIRERRSIRNFKPDMPSKTDLNQIIEAGLYAASGRNEQAVITIAVTNKEFRDKLMKDNCKIGGWNERYDPFYGAPVILIVLGRRSRITYLYDGSLVIGNMMLAAHSLGLGSIWIHRAKEEFETEEYQSLLKELGIEGEWEGIGHCAIGYMDCELPEPPVRKDNRVYWIE